MQHHKGLRLVLLILASILLLSGCKQNVAFILPPEATGDTVLISKHSTTVPTTIPTIEETQPTEHQHSYTQTITEPTCTDMGYTTHTCDCGDSFTDNQIEPLGHSYVVTSVAPTTQAPSLLRQALRTPPRAASYSGSPLLSSSQTSSTPTTVSCSCPR